MRSRMRLGLGFLAEVFTIDEKVRYASMGEKNGFDSAWVAEHYFSRDAIVTATAILSRTTRMKVGTAVINPYTRHPGLLAMTSATLDEMSKGRFILGLGTSFPRWIEVQMKIDYGKPMTSLMESLRIVRALLDRSADTVEGKRFSIHGASLGFNTDSGRIPIYLAAVGPRMLEKTAELADGVILSAGSSPYYVRKALLSIKQGLAKSGKKRFRVVCLALISMSSDRKQAREELKPWVLMPLLRTGRAKLVLGTEETVAKSKAAWDAGDRKKAMTLVPDEVMDAVSLSGKPEDILKGVEKFKGLGITDLVLTPVQAETRELPALMKALAKRER
jgi:5,10-methylenetetrahydromethanopterin reductase